MPLVVHCWADLQSVHELRCYGNITRTRNVSEYMLVLALCLVFFIFFARCEKLFGFQYISVSVYVHLCATFRGTATTGTTYRMSRDSDAN